jgi:hypothetical protein
MNETKWYEIQLRLKVELKKSFKFHHQISLMVLIKVALNFVHFAWKEWKEAKWSWFRAYKSKGPQSVYYTKVGFGLAWKYVTRMEMTKSDKHCNLIWIPNKLWPNKLYSTVWGLKIATSRGQLSCSRHPQTSWSRQGQTKNVKFAILA